jgi:hypothetical protein
LGFIDELAIKPTTVQATKGGGIDSRQNGILLQATLHSLWDSLLLSYDYVPPVPRLSYC